MNTIRFRPGMNNELVMQVDMHVDVTDPAFIPWSPTSALPEDMLGWLVSLHVPANCIKEVNALSCVVLVDKKYSWKEASKEGRAQIFDKIPISYFNKIGLTGVIRSELYKFDHPGEQVPCFCDNCGKIECMSTWCSNPPPNVYTDVAWAAELTRWTMITSFVSCEPLCLDQVRLV